MTKADARISDNSDIQSPAKRSLSADLLIFLQLVLLLLLVQLFEVEQQRSLLTVLSLATAGSLVMPRVPDQWKTMFPAGLTCIGLLLLFGWQQSVGVLFIVGLFTGICYAPVSLLIRLTLLLTSAILLIRYRSGTGFDYRAIAGSLLMFRLLVFLFETRRQSKLPPAKDALAYFLLLPNICFPLFPVVSFTTWKRTRQDRLTSGEQQIGINWMVLGVVHLLLYRVIRYWLLIPPEQIADGADLLRFLTANYGLYLHVAGQFHISIGILHLFGYRLPKTHDWFFLASSFTDIWRRINIYWKDFMSAVFFMPTFFRLRSRLGARAAICIGVAVTFAATWLAHSWQTFWLLGDFPFTGHDAALWGAAGIAVMINSLWDYQQTRSPSRSNAASGLLHRSLRTLQISGVFLCVSLFWAEWTNPGFLSQLPVSPSLWNPSPGGWLMVLLICGIILPLLAARLPSADRFHSHRLKINVVVLGLLLIPAAPGLTDHLPNDLARVLTTFRSENFTQSESSRLVQGYYEELNTGSLQASVYGPETSSEQTGRVVGRQHFMDLTRPRNDALELELIPGFQGKIAGRTITINDWGMRNPPLKQSAAHGTWRLAVLGSSVVMGYGVGDNDYFCRMLERRLNSESSDLSPWKRAEVLNFGIGKYYVIHQDLQLQEKVLRFEPDAVLYLCHQAEQVGPILDLARMQAHDLVTDPGLQAIVNQAGITDETPAGPMRVMLQSFGPQIVENGYRRITARCRRHNIAPLWGYLKMPGPFAVDMDHAAAAAMADSAGFEVLNLHGWDDGYTTADVMLRDGDPHANPDGHRLIADLLFDELSRIRPWNTATAEAD